MFPRFLRALTACALLAACSGGRDVHFDGSPANGQAAPAIALTDQDGASWTLASQKGKAVALFFGFTHCEDTCPATLAMLTHAISTLPDPSKAEVVFVTVDRERDTPVVLRRYVKQFDLAPVIGLTGSTSDLKTVYGAYHIWAQKIPGSHTDGGYDVAHSSNVLLIDPDGNLRVYHDWNDPEKAFVHDLKALTT